LPEGSAAAAPIAATPSALRPATGQQVEPVQWWGFGPYDYYAPGYYPSYGWNPGGAPPAPGYATGYQAGAADAAACMQRFRSYDPVSRTYIGRDRQRHPCP
jgi:BA14K-like protein